MCRLYHFACSHSIAPFLCGNILLVEAIRVHTLTWNIRATPLVTLLVDWVSFSQDRLVRHLSESSKL